MCAFFSLNLYIPGNMGTTWYVHSLLVISADHQSGIMQHGVNSAFAYFDSADHIPWRDGNSLPQNNFVECLESRRFMTVNPHMISRYSRLGKRKEGPPLKGPWKMGEYALEIDELGMGYCTRCGLWWEWKGGKEASDQRAWQEMLHFFFS